MRKQLFLFFILVGLVLFFLSWTTSLVEAEPSGKVSIFTTIPQKIIDTIKDDFIKKYPGIELEITRKGATGIQSYVELELGSPKGLTADLIWTSDPIYLIDLKRRNILYQYTTPEKDNLAFGNDAHNYYYGARLMTVIIAFSSDRVYGEDVPTSWEDLLKPRFSGKIAIADPLTSGTSFDAVAALKDKFGWEYFEELFENGVTVMKNNSKVNDAVLNGVVDVGITLDYMARERHASGEPIQLVYPKDGLVVVPSPIAITYSSNNKAGAKAFMDYILSANGQEQMVNLGNFLPVRSDIFPPENAPRMQQLVEQQIPIRWDDLATDIIRVKGRYFDIMKQYNYYAEPEDY
ncbi:MAG: hypothetical protein B6244_06590 [Candidatus Cloacimonetes bacterium 4572_55]|nr:MAG: hypothetical protein B6244_06590 [Candidatus Cloacimonetes bacterium 4572_55]